MGRWHFLIAQGLAAFGLGFYFLVTGEKLEETFVPRVICQVWTINERCSVLLKNPPAANASASGTTSQHSAPSPKPAEPDRPRPQLQGSSSGTSSPTAQGTTSGPRTPTDDINNVLRGK